MRTLLILLLLLCAAGSLVAQEQDSAELPEQLYAPYVYMARYPVYQLAPTAQATGIRYFSLAFILGTPACQPMWMATLPLENSFITDFLLPDLEALRALGGDVIVSFGGAGGSELAQVCPDVSTLQAAYQQVIDAYGVTRLDFDIEGDDLRQPDVIDRRSQAIAALQAEASVQGKPLLVSMTLPVQPTGLTEEGLYVLESALEYGVRVDTVNIMTMNFGQEFPPDQMGANTIQAARSLFAQLQTLYPDEPESSLWQRIGLTPMIGLNDRQTQRFQLSDAEQVTDFAIEQGVGLLAIWSLDRDQPCEYESSVSFKCSSVEQELLQFSQIFNRVLRAP